MLSFGSRLLSRALSTRIIASASLRTQRKRKLANQAPKRFPLLPQGKSYEDIYSTFKWDIPEYYNIGDDICDKHIRNGYGANTAIIYENESGRTINFTFNQLKKYSDAMGYVLQEKYGVKKGDRIGILLTQSPQTVISHVAVYKIGCIAIPLFTQFGHEAIKFRLNNSEARILITDAEDLQKVSELSHELPNLETIIVTDYSSTGLNRRSLETLRAAGKLIVKFDELITEIPYRFTTMKTSSEDPAIIIFTSGTTGPPKGALHAHRVLLGHLPGVEFPHNLFPKHGDNSLLFYTPADWAWIGGLIDVLLPSLHHGVPVLAYRSKRKFDPNFVFELMDKHKVRHAFMPPTALKLMRQHNIPASKFMYSIGSGGESLGQELLDWGKKTFGVTINEFYGQTEANLLLGNCSAIMDVKPGSIGRPIPGALVDIIDDKGKVLPAGQSGNIAVKRPHPVMFLEYWRNEEATKKKFVGDWLVTGDLGKKDEQGYFWFVGRSDDVIKCSGYRIGPSEIENCLLRHPSVALSAAIGVPDETRGEIVKAFVILKSGIVEDSELKKSLQEHVKKYLAAYEYPREIEFVKELPMTTTGKIQRNVLRDMEKEKRKNKDK
eukprot:TRINITY_DN4375_c0_g1_i1.p1 TRINITY_DN4375_c0_g1~~TRINITY_DN4375_c0_g1_i1.p1  ORF type:complete len:606 (-),score=91.34 TRINITY_DN4375_c0_g1_i1:217-2034(-)